MWQIGDSYLWEGSMFMFQSDWGWGGRKMGDGGGEGKKKVGRLGGEVGVAVRRRCGVSGGLATPGVPTPMLSTHQ